MKKLLSLAIVFCALVFTATTSSASDFEGKSRLGIMGTGFYEISDYESLYTNFVASNLNVSGGGVSLFYEYGFTKNISGSINLGYSRLVDSDQFLNQLAQNFFVADVLGHYNFNVKSDIFKPFVSFGAGIIASSSGVAPLADLGGGVNFMIADNFAIKLQVLYKTAIIHHRAEAGLGFAIQF